MKNVSAKMEGDVLVLRINTGKAHRDSAEPSKSGKTKVLATTSGFTRFEDVGVSLNVTIPA